MNRLNLEEQGPVLMHVLVADDQKEDEWDVIHHFALFTQSFQMGFTHLNAWAGKDASPLSCSTVSGVCCTCSRFRWSPPEQEQIISSINNKVPKGSHQ